MRPGFFLAVHLFTSAVGAWSCGSIELGDSKYDFTALDDEYTISLQTKTPPTIRHTTYTLNPCSSLKKDKDVSEEDQCAPGTSVCKVTSVEKDSKSTVIEVLSLGGIVTKTEGPVVKKLVESDGLEGIEIVYPGVEETNQMSASIQFICDEDVKVGKPEHISGDDKGVAHFKWRTKHACTKSTGGGDPKKPDKDFDPSRPPRTPSWGFFTWLFVIVFMAIASFLIFTLFLNYNRYGQVGLDLVPAMDSVKVCT